MRCDSKALYEAVVEIMATIAIVLPNQLRDASTGVTNIELEAEREGFDLCLREFAC